MKNKTKFRVLSILSIIILCIVSTHKIIENDTFYMIKLGDYIFHNGIDKIDHYCWITKLPYTYPHWLYDLFIYIIYKHYNYTGIYVNNIISFILFILTIYFINLKAHKNEFLSFFIAIIIIMALNPFITARGQVISLIIFNLEIYFINKLIKKGNNKYIIYLTISSLLIANIHGTAWLFFFILYLPFIAEHIIYILINKSQKLKLKKNKILLIEKQKNIKKLIISFILSFLMGILTPSKICYTYIIKIMLGNSQNFISEHLPLIIINYPLYITIILVLIITLITIKVKIHLNEIFLISGITIMSLKSTRHLSFFYTIALLYIGIIIIRALHQKKEYTLDKLSYIIVNNKKVLLLTILIIVILSQAIYSKTKKEKYFTNNDYPIKAVEYIKNNLNYKNIKLYNEYNYGSYLLFNNIPVFIDSRCDLYLKEFNNMNYSIFNETQNIEFKYEKIFKKHNVTHILLNKNNELYPVLIKDNNYNIIYQDKAFILFKKIIKIT